jgi:hypothetical protein
MAASALLGQVERHVAAARGGDGREVVLVAQVRVP